MNKPTKQQQKDKTEKTTVKAQEAYNKAVESGKSHQEATVEAVKNIAAQTGGAVDLTGGSGKIKVNGQAAGAGAKLTLTNKDGDTGHFYLKDNATAEDGYSFFEETSQFLQGTPGRSGALNLVTQMLTSNVKFNKPVRQNDMYKYSMRRDAYMSDKHKALLALSQGYQTPGFDLENEVVRTNSWTDMSQPISYGPWRQEYIFPADRVQISTSDSNALSAASRLHYMGERISLGTTTSVELAQKIDVATGQIINAQAGNHKVKYHISGFNFFDNVTLAATTYRDVELPHSSFYYGGEELVRQTNVEMSSTQSSKLASSSPVHFEMVKKLGQLGDVIELGLDTYNNFNQDGLSTRALVATGVDFIQMVGSGVISSVVGTASGDLAGTGMAVTGVGAPAAPVVATGVGVAVGVYTDNVIDAFYESHIRTPMINGITNGINGVATVYEWGIDTYNWIVD